MANLLWNVGSGIAASFNVASNWTVLANLSGAPDVNTIEAGGQAVTSQDLTLGSSVRQSSTLILEGAGTSLSAEGVGVGVFGTGALAIMNGATLVTSGAGGVDSVGYESGGNGTVDIDGIGSRWNSNSAFLNVGYEGQGVLDVVNGGALVMAGYLAVEAAAGVTALVTLVGPASSLAASGGVMVDGGGGRLRLFTGATLTTGGSLDSVGDLTGAGRASVSGLGAVWRENALSLAVGAATGNCGVMVSDGGSLIVAQMLQIGGGSMTGTLDVRAGGVVRLTAASQSVVALVAIGAQAGGGGTVTVAGAGATLDTGGNPLLLGQYGGATLEIGAGGSVTAASLNDTQLDTAAAFTLGTGAGGSALLSVSGAGALLTINGGGFAGSGGTATISVTAGGELVAGDSASVAGGFGLGIGAGSPDPGGTRIVSGGGATLTVSAGGTVIERNSFGVGLHGSAGAVTIGASGVLEFSGQMSISAGDATVGAGNGAVTITAGGSLACLGPTVAASLAAQGLPALVIGEGNYGDGAAGTLVVAGPGATANFASYGVAVGGAVASDLTAGGGAGYLTISGGGALQCGSSGAGSAALAVGVGATSMGSVVIAGAGSELSAAGAVAIGAAGSGTIAIQAGATLSAASLQVGGGGGGSGTLTEANGAVLTLGSAGLTIGAGGAATLQGAFAAGQIVGFTGAGGLLDIANPAAFHGVVEGFQSGDTVEIAGLTSSDATITVSGGNTILTLSTGGAIAFAGLYGQNGAGLATLLGIGGAPQSEALANISLDDVAPMTAAPLFAAGPAVAASPAEPAASTVSPVAMGHDPPFTAAWPTAWTSAFANDMSSVVAAIGLTESAAALAQTVAASLAAQRHW